MPIYNYQAINEEGKKISGELAAANEQDLEERLSHTDFVLLKCKKAKIRKGLVFSGVKVKELIIFCSQMEQLTGAGISLLEAVSIARDSVDSAKLRDILSDIYESVSNGSLLSEAMAEHPQVFSATFTGLISVGEKTGNLSEAFVNLGDHIKWMADIKRKIKKSLGYPILLMVVVVSVVTLMMLMVVPQLVEFLESQNFELPFYTKALIAFSNIFTENWHLLFGIPIVISIVAFVLYRIFPAFAYFMDNIFLRMPFFGRLTRKIEIARFTHVFSVMFTSGIDVLESLENASLVIKNKVLKEAIKTAQQRVSDGSSLYSSLEMSNQFPRLVVRMFQTGEETGRMKQSLDNIGFFYDREVNDSIDIMVGLIQPTLTMVLGMIVMWIVVAVFSPLYDTFEGVM